MARSIRQNIAESKGRIFPRSSGQYMRAGSRRESCLTVSSDRILPMPKNYRDRLANNLAALLSFHGLSAETLKARYIDGPKAGRNISIRTIRNVVRNDEGSSGLSVDGLGAIAARFGIEAYHLLAPGLDPITQPTAQAESWIESEVDRRLVSRLRRAGPLSKALKGADDGEVVSKPSGSDANRHMPNPAATAKHGVRKGTTASKKAAKRTFTAG
jgi:hypothetical protein